MSWVRLAQRIPVGTAIDKVPPGIDLITGRMVTVMPNGAENALGPGRSE